MKTKIPIWAILVTAFLTTMACRWYARQWEVIKDSDGQRKYDMDQYHGSAKYHRDNVRGMMDYLGKPEQQHTAALLRSTLTLCQGGYERHKETGELNLLGATTEIFPDQFPFRTKLAAVATATFLVRRFGTHQFQMVFFNENGKEVLLRDQKLEFGETNHGMYNHIFFQAVFDAEILRSGDCRIECRILGHATNVLKFRVHEPEAKK